MNVVEESVRAENTRVERLERELATEIEERQEILAKRRETSETESRKLVENDDFFQGLQSKVVAITAERNEKFDLATVASEKLKTSEANVALQSSHLEAVLEDIEARTAEIVELQEQLTARSAELSYLSQRTVSQPTS